MHVDYDGDKAEDGTKAEKKLSAALKAKRRGDIFTESINPKRSLKIKSVPKSKSVRDMIGKAMKRNILFGEIAEAQKNSILDSMFLEEIAEDVNIITQGEKGDRFYVVESGEFDFKVDKKKVGSCAPGESFGELALLYNCPRAATVVSRKAAKLWVLDRVTFRMIVARGAAKSHDAIYKSLKKAPVLRGLKSEQLGKLVDAVAAVHFNSGDTIIRKGDDGNIFYIITKGSVRVTKVGTGDAKEMTLKEGDYFGERALLTSEPRAANVIAQSYVECLALDREAFNNLLGPLKDVLDDNLGMRVLHSIPILDKLKEAEFKSLLAVFKKEHFKDGEVIISQDAPGNQFFIIRDGTAEVVKDVAGSTPASITRLSNGDYFGEGALLKDEPRNASVIARGSVLCLVVYRDDFERIFGPLKEIMNREYDSRVDMAITKVKRKSDAAAKAAQNTAQSNIKFDDLRMLRTLGTGTFGRVKLVEHRPTKKTYALKMLQKAQVVAYRQQTNVMNEKDIMAEADHPFVLKLYRTFKDRDSLYMLLELVQGGELFSLLHTKGGKLPATDARFYSACAIDALVYLHDKSIVYRDLKPENLLLDNKGFIKVVDFGFAKRVTDKTFTLCGTPEYLAPELVLGKGHNRAVDYWAIGILVYEMLVGSSPFADHQNNDHMVICKNIVKGVVDYPKKFNDKGKDFVSKLLVRDAHLRLGMMRAGADDVKSHPWFKSIDFEKLRNLEVAAPWVPSINNPYDTSNFEPYDEDSYVEPYVDTGSNWDAKF